jgi:MFS family permease
LILLICASLGAVSGGWWVSRKSAPAGSVLRTSSSCFFLMAPAVAIIGIAPSPMIALVALCYVAFLIGIPAGLAPAAYYEISPNEFRGQLVSLYLMAGTILPYCVGIVLIAACTDYVFKSDLAVGKSMSIVLTASAIAGGFLLRGALRLRLRG